jgi:hypothetical protein
MLITNHKGTKEYKGENPKSVDEFKKTLDSLLLEMKFERTVEDFFLYEKENLAVILYDDGSLFLPYKTNGISFILKAPFIEIKECNAKIHMEKHICYNVLFDIIRVMWKCYKVDASEELFVNSVGYYSDRLKQI